MGILEQIAIGIVPIAIGFGAGRAWDRLKFLRKYGHLRRVLHHAHKVQIVVSHVEVSRFKTVTGSPVPQLQVPRNVLYMPMPEGRAIASLMSLLHKINYKLEIQLVTETGHDPSVPTLSIGGPSVNEFSGRILAEEFPEFKIEYPATKRARYGGHAFETLLDGNNMLLRDYGFIFVTRTTRRAPCLVFCGIRAYGTAMAVELLRNLPPRSEAAQMIGRGGKGMIVAEGRISGLEETAVRLSSWREVPTERVLAKLGP